MNAAGVSLSDTERPDGMTIIIVWVTGFGLVSALPDIAFRTLTGTAASPIWIPALVFVLVLAVFGLIARSAASPHLRRYTGSLVGLGMGYLVESILENSALWVAWNHALPPGTSFVLVNSAKLIPVTILALSLVGSRLTRHELFLAVGDLRASFLHIRRGITVSWGAVLPVAIAISVVPVIANVSAVRHPEFASIARLLPLLPLIVGGAAVNTFSEEFLFRQVLLARLIPTVGIGQAVWLTSLRFGLGHWFGNPSGITGVLLATVFGWFAARSMVDTRGSVWAWVIHLINDVVIFTLVALTVTRYV